VFWPRVGRFARQLREDSAQVVHITTTGPVGLAGCWIARRAGVSVTASVHAPVSSLAAGSGLPPRMAAVGERLARWAFDSCQSILAPSRAAAAALAARGFARLLVWPRGVDTTRFAPNRASSSLREIWHVDHRRPAILVPLAPMTKSEVELIEPIRRSLYRHAIAHQFVFLGRHRTDVALREICPDGVFVESRPDDDLAAVIASCDVCLFPATADVAGGTLLQAQASGLPAVVPDSGGAKEQVVPGQTACLTLAGDVGDVVSSLASLLRNSGRRAEMGRAARAHALEHEWPAGLRALHDAWRIASRMPPAGDAGPRSVAAHEAA
jgi:glycosyltransferase involved in cell wall biosynthesis